MMKSKSTDELASILAHHAQWVSTGHKEGARADLRHVNLRGADLRGANLRGADLYGADLYGANLYGADLQGADLREADLQGADLQGADLQGADLQGADLGETKVVQMGPLGSRRDYLVVMRFSDGTLDAQAGCFHGTLEALEAAVAETHAHHPPYQREYQAAIAYARAMVFPADAEEVAHAH